MHMNTLLIPMLVAVAAAVTAQKTNTKPMDTNLSELQKATFGGGCFARIAGKNERF